MTREEYFKYFEDTTAKMLDISKRKSNDYTGHKADPFANFRSVETLGICSVETGFLTRMNDKMSRAVSLLSGTKAMVSDESITDTLLDLSNYCILLTAYLASKKGNTHGK